jgi:hypothetical protein
MRRQTTWKGRYLLLPFMVCPRTTQLTPFNGLTTEDKWLYQNPAELANLVLEYNNRVWGFSGMIKYYYVGSRFMSNDAYNIVPPLEPAKWGDLAFSQTFFDNVVTLYFGIRNFSDAQYSILGSTATPAGPIRGEIEKKMLSGPMEGARTTEALKPIWISTA